MAATIMSETKRKEEIINDQRYDSEELNCY